jgi:Na+/melibiose symporter-like transporter
MVPAMLNTLMNGPFRILLPAWACDAFCNAIVQCMIPYFVMIVIAPSHVQDDDLNCGDEDSPNYNPWFCQTGRVIGICGICVLLAAIVALPLWHLAVARLGKVKAWWCWSLTMALTNVLFLFLGRGNVVSLWIVAALNGAPLGAKFIADAILSDIIDYDEFLTGQRNEATYFMFKSFLPKIVQIPASAIPIALLGTVGYKPPIGTREQLQPDSVVIYVKVVVVMCFVASCIAFLLKRRYPLCTDEHIRQLRLGLAAHRELKPYPDPVTGVSYPPTCVPEDLQRMYWLLDHFREPRLRQAFDTTAVFCGNAGLDSDVGGSVSTGEADADADADAEGGGGGSPQSHGSRSGASTGVNGLLSGAERVVRHTQHQLAAAIAGLVLSVVCISASMPLIRHPSWQFVPTLAAVSAGLCVVLCLVCFLRRQAARRIRACAQSRELTSHMVRRVLSHRDLLGKVGVPNTAVVPGKVPENVLDI